MWCTDSSDPMPHEAHPGRRPSRYLSEHDVVAYALRLPRHRPAALLALQSLAPRERREVDTSAPRPPSSAEPVTSNAATADTSRKSVFPAPPPAPTGGTAAAAPAGPDEAVADGAAFRHREFADEAPPPSATETSSAAKPPPSGELQQQLSRLRGKIVSLQEQVAHLEGIIEEKSQSAARTDAKWLALSRVQSVPDSPAALDGLPPQPR